MNDPLALSIEEVQAATGLGRTKVYEIINSGSLPAKKVGKRTVILRADLDAFLCDLKPYDSKKSLAPEEE